MPFDINEFKANVLQNGLVKSNLYLVNFQASKWFNRGSLFFYTDSVSLPAVDLETMTINRYGYGPAQQYVFRPVFTPLSMDFMIDASGTNALTAALGSMTEVTNFMGYNNINDAGTLYGGQPYEVAYKDDYKFQLDVYIYNEQADVIMQYAFRDCFAKQIGSIQMGWGNNDQLMRLPLTFSYTDYSMQTYDGTLNLFQRLDNLLSVSPKQLALRLASYTFSALNVPSEVGKIINVVNNRTLHSIGGLYNQIY
jgi:hypothetical protein